MRADIHSEPNKSFFNSWIPHLKKSQLHENVFSTEDIQWLTDHMFRRHHEAKLRNSGTMVFTLFQKQHEIVKRFEKQIRSIVPDFDDIHFGGNYYIACHPYSIHTDSCLQSEMEHFGFKVIPYRQLIVPMNVSPMKSAGEKAGVVTFKQRYLNYGTIFCQGQIPDSVKGSWKDIYCHKGLDFYTFERGIEAYDDSKLFDPEFYKKYLDNLPYTNLNNLGVEDLFPFVPGSCIEIDACQLHTSVNFRKHGIMHKTGLALNLFKKL